MTLLKKIIITSLFSASLLEAACAPTLLGVQNQQISFDTLKNSILWQKKALSWESRFFPKKINKDNLKCSSESYLLLNTPQVVNKNILYSQNFYKLHAGWNYLHSHTNGVDVIKTFRGLKDIEFVYVYERFSKVWAGFSPVKEIQEKIFHTRILFLKKIEPNVGFYVYAKKPLKVKIVSPLMSKRCQKILQSNDYSDITDSGIDAGMVYNKTKNIGIQSRYLSHYRRGIYDDTRITLIYPKLTSAKSAEHKYGPAVPKSMIEYAKVYEGQKFYMYDYRVQKCYMGLFPSRKIPPFASLKEIK